MRRALRPEPELPGFLPLEVHSRMGLSASKQAEGKLCIECDRKTQKDVPLDDSSSASKGMLCEEIYTRVGRLGKGRAIFGFAPCAREWGEFKQCHTNSRK
ncbi:hypothetical protein ACHAW5_004944 [Stephanodiscus triporus]|uniref:Uncharacterized protein n=1 Tax=Stephanodiscus triporus TaxID=2934178 RepID=A0ABD3NAR6_9STRA